MNDNHSLYEWKYRPRWLGSLLQEAVTTYRVVVLTGARQVGKSTLLQHLFPTWRYLSLDDLDARAQAERDPHALWAGTAEIILDEVQKAPTLLEATKQAVDRRTGPRFVLSGSANLLLMARVSESLAGRAVYFTLSPMTWGELHGRPAPDALARLLTGALPPEGTLASADPAEPIARGLMPPLLSLPTQPACTRWWEGYIATYLERDLRQLARIEALADFQRLMTALALRSGQLLNQSEVARDTAIPQPTVHRYINLLEASHLLERLPAYAISRTKRLIKAPKVYWADPALAAHLAGYYDAASVSHAKEYGALFETLVLHHLRVLGGLVVPRARLFYWRTAAGHEVDFVVEHGRRLVAVEVKLSAQPRYGDAEQLRLFLREYPHARCGVLVHTGRQIRYLDEKIIAVPWSWLAG